MNVRRHIWERLCQEVAPADVERGRVKFFGGSARQPSVENTGPLTIVSKTQQCIRIRRLYLVGVGPQGLIDPSLYRVMDLKVGNQSQFHSLAPVPGELFSPDMFHDTAMSLDLLRPGLSLMLRVDRAPPQSEYTFGALAEVW